MVRWKMAVLAGAAISLAGADVRGSWAGLDPAGFAHGCPVIVSGEIVRIDEAATKAAGRVGGRARVLDVAHIRIAAVHRNVLTDVEAKVGGTIPARMNSKRDTIATSIDLRYPVGTKALWLLVLREDGHLYLNRHPVQRQPVRAARKVLARLPREVSLTKDGRTTTRTHTIKEWLAAQREGRRRQSEARKRQEAVQAKARGAVRDLYTQGQLQEARLPTLLKLPAAVRSELINMRPEVLGIAAEDAGAVRCYLAEHDPVENHRVRALSGLSVGCGYPRGRPILLKALKDASRRVRLFACQTLMFTKDKTAAVAVAPLLTDVDREVRLTAVRTLGWLGGAEHVEPILDLYAREKPGMDDQWYFADALGRLGEQTVSLRAAASAMKSRNWNVRYFAVLAISFNQSRSVVPAIVTLLPAELRQTVQEMKAPRVGDRVLVGLCRELGKRTGLKHGCNVLAWLNWWRSSHTMLIGFDADEIDRLQREYQRLKEGQQR